MPTKIVTGSQLKPAMATLVSLTLQKLIMENQNGNTGLSQLSTMPLTYANACAYWPASMAVAAAIVANTYEFSSSSLDALNDSNAP